MPVIQFDKVSKSYNRSAGRNLLRSHVTNFFTRRSHMERFFALSDISFKMEHGESVALVGHNGAGKSTLLSLLAGVSYPDGGMVQTEGKIAALLELGSGFHPDLTGRENILLNAAMLGLTRQQVLERYDRIVDFSGVGEFMEEPIRTYSSGMIMRLAFSVATNVDPDILIVDEVIAVGDQDFQVKCLNKINEFRAAGKTMVCVSHASSTIRKLCQRAIWLDHGKLMLDGPIDDVITAYEGRSTFRNGA
ncbi:MAG: ABC transporter ATP-binding protein [Bryobacteraceae bacterium]